MTTGIRKDPYASFRFLVEITGLIVGGFSEVSGLEVETETEEYREGGVNDYVHKLPKITRHPNLVLKRGLTDADALWSWHQQAVGGNVSRKSGCVVLLDDTGSEKWRWTFQDAYPVRWSGPEFKGDAATVAVEVLELAHRGIRKG
ncbi:MAG: phage tail protein [Bacillota bacterium]